MHENLVHLEMILLSTANTVAYCGWLANLLRIFAHR